MIDGFSLQNYRSYGNDPQRITGTGRINIIIGKNNAGKSNVLRALAFVIPWLAANDSGRRAPNWDDSTDTSHFSDQPPRFGLFSAAANFDQASAAQRSGPAPLLQKFIDACAETPTPGLWFYRKKTTRGWEFEPDENVLKIAKRAYPNRGELQNAAAHLCGSASHSEWENAKSISELFDPFNVPKPAVLIPATRSTQFESTGSEIRDDIIYLNGIADLKGSGLINRLSKLQNPTHHDAKSRLRFASLLGFVRSIVNDESANVQVTWDKSAINLTIDNQILPLQNYGSGIEQVLIIAAAATAFENYIVCLEEPETDLHPEFQIRLLNFLQSQTDNQYFASTHSHSVIDLGRASLHSVQKTKSGSTIAQLTTAADKHELVFDLGYRPSDLAQCNSIIWVEGPSDRIYLRAALAVAFPKLIEGVHFTIMFYGGRLLRHLSADDDQIDQFIVLTNINRRSAILIDSDMDSETDSLNATKQRVLKEFGTRGLFTWVTAGREIENYVAPDDLNAAVAALWPGVSTTVGQFADTCTGRTTNADEIKFDKVKLAHHLVQRNALQFTLDWYEKLSDLADFIRRST